MGNSLDTFAQILLMETKIALDEEEERKVLKVRRSTKTEYFFIERGSEYEQLLEQVNKLTLFPYEKGVIVEGECGYIHTLSIDSRIGEMVMALKTFQPPPSFEQTERVKKPDFVITLR